MKGLSKSERGWFAIMRIIIDIVENCVGAGVLRIGIIAMNRKHIRKISLRRFVVNGSSCSDISIRSYCVIYDERMKGKRRRLCNGR